MDEISDLLTYGVEELQGILRAKSTSNASLKNIEEVFKEISELIGTQKKGMTSGLRELSVALMSRHLY